MVNNVLIAIEVKQYLEIYDMPIYDLAKPQEEDEPRLVGELIAYSCCVVVVVVHNVKTSSHLKPLGQS